jgi:hypothetical protein
MDCLNRAAHTPSPSGIVAWQSWAAAMYASGHRQTRCPECLRYVIWNGLRPAASVHEHERACLNALDSGRLAIPPADQREA